MPHRVTKNKAKQSSAARTSTGLPRNLRSVAMTFGVCFSLSMGGVAQACTDPTEGWLFETSDVVFDALANCDAEQETCLLLVRRVLKKPTRLSLRGRQINVDFQETVMLEEADSDTLFIVCWSPLFQPEQVRFHARFYANLDEQTSELVVRRVRIRDEEDAL